MIRQRILVVGKKSEPWVAAGIERFLERLRPPFAAEMSILPSSSKTGLLAAQEESERILARITDEEFVILLDERGTIFSSPEISQLLGRHAAHKLCFIIGGAYGVTEALRQRAQVIWSLSRLVFPHQLVRLLLAEQLYRAQEIAKGSRYHHE